MQEKTLQDFSSDIMHPHRMVTSPFQHSFFVINITNIQKLIHLHSQ